jgi:hypothetical protein
VILGDIKGAIADYQMYLSLGGGHQNGNEDEITIILKELSKTQR